MQSVALTSRGPRATERIAGELALAVLRWISQGGEAPLIGLQGPMGAGKTAFVRGFVGALPNGAGQPVASPTWSLLHLYSSVPPVAHIDAWRLGASDDPDTLGLEQVPPESIVIVEWITNVPQLASRQLLEVSIAPRTASTRSIVLSSSDKAAAELIDPLRALSGRRTARR